MEGAIVILLAVALAGAGVWAVVRGCIDEYRARGAGLNPPDRTGRVERVSDPDADESILMDEIEEWLKQQS